ncbi:hypothetical protein ACQ4LE_000186 [Meloidogyne hapla]|uniref:DUF202 domain-containing protein n=1 Tax=Meloidogyne hapla TaxID=6305 RepID=A0A1I8BIE5_MELHA
MDSPPKSGSIPEQALEVLRSGYQELLSAFRGNWRSIIKVLAFCGGVGFSMYLLWMRWDVLIASLALIAIALREQWTMRRFQEEVEKRGWFGTIASIAISIFSYYFKMKNNKI